MSTLSFSAANPLKRQCLAVGVIGLVLTALGFFLDRTQFFTAYLEAYLFILAFPMGCFALLMIHTLTGGNWGWTARPFFESAIRTLPLLALLFIPIVLGAHHLYPWMGEEAAHDPMLARKASYLNVPFWLGRTAFYFISWIALSTLLLRWVMPSPQSMTAANIGKQHRVQRLAAGGILFYALSISFAAIDWVMSLEPHWFSSIFGVLVFAGWLNSTFCMVILVGLYLHRRSPNPWFTEKNLHDLSKFLFMSVMFWAYISISQFLIIYSGNLPEETVWFWQRGHGGWQYVSSVLVFCQFVVPFLVLLSARRKKNPKVLFKIIPMMLAIRVLEQIYLVAPGLREGRSALHWLDLVAPLGLGGLWAAAFLYFLSGNSGVPMPQTSGHGHHDKAVQ